MMTIWRNNTGTWNHITCQSSWRFCPRWLLWSYNRTLTQSTRDESTWFGLYFTAHRLRNYMARTLGRNLKRNQQGSHHWLPRLLTHATQDHLLGCGASHSGLPPSITNQENAPQHMTIRQSEGDNSSFDVSSLLEFPHVLSSHVAMGKEEAYLF